jgi:hypothetical protein
MAKITITYETEANETLLRTLLEYLGRPGQDSPLETSPSGITAVIAEEGDNPMITRAQLAFAQRLLGDETRLKVANGQKALINALIDVPWEEGLDRDELLERMGRSNRELSGLLGALGKRVAGTYGFEEVQDGQSPINAILYSKKEGKWCYRLKPWFRHALELLHEDGQVQWLRDGKKW